MIFSFQPKKIYYGHARTAVLQENEELADAIRSGSASDNKVEQSVADRERAQQLGVLQNILRQKGTGQSRAEQQVMGKFGTYLPQETEQKNQKLYHTVKQIMRYIDKGMSIDKIASKLKVERDFVDDVCRMYLTHQNVGVQGILDRIEIKGK